MTGRPVRPYRRLRLHPSSGAVTHARCGYSGFRLSGGYRCGTAPDFHRASPSAHALSCRTGTVRTLYIVIHRSHRTICWVTLSRVGRLARAVSTAVSGPLEVFISVVGRGTDERSNRYEGHVALKSQLQITDYRRPQGAVIPPFGAGFRLHRGLDVTWKRAGLHFSSLVTSGSMPQAL